MNEYSSSELLDCLYDTPDGEEAFIKLCEIYLNKKITFNPKRCIYIVEDQQ